MRTIASIVLLMAALFLPSRICLGIQVTENLATQPARRPQWIIAGDKLLLSWVTPLRFGPDIGMLTDDYMQLHYFVIAEKDKPLPKYPVKGKALSIASRSTGKFSFYRFTQDSADPGKIFLVDLYDDGYNSRAGLDVHVRKVIWNDVKNTLAVDSAIMRFPPRKPDDEYGESQRVAVGYPVISYMEPCLVVNNDQWRISYLSRDLPEYGGGVFSSESTDGGKTWGAVSCVQKGDAQLQAFAAYADTSYVAAVIFEMKRVYSLAGGGQALRGWPDDEFDKNENRDHIPYFGKLWVSKVNKNMDKPLSQLIDANEDVEGVALLAIKNVVYIVYERGDSSRGSLWAVKSIGDDKWSKPIQLTNENNALDREPCITQFNNEIWIAFSRSDNGKASVIDYIKLDDKQFGDEK